VGFEPTIPVSTRPQTYVLDRGYTGARTDTTELSGKTPDRKHKWVTVLLTAASTLNDPPGVLSLSLKSDRGSQLVNRATNSRQLAAGDVNVTYASDDNSEELLQMDSNLCLKFTKSRSGGFISFGNQELRENILNCARY
jgi:hypothetical protein